MVYLETVGDLIAWPPRPEVLDFRPEWMRNRKREI